MSSEKKIEFEAHFSCDNLDAIEVQVFARLTSHNLELANSLLTLFKDQMQKYIRDFGLAHEKDDKLHLIHAIKGAARCIAAEKLATLASEIEKLLRRDDQPNEELVKEFFEASSQVMNYIHIIESRAI